MEPWPGLPGTQREKQPQSKTSGAVSSGKGGRQAREGRAVSALPTAGSLPSSTCLQPPQKADALHPWSEVRAVVRRVLSYRRTHEGSWDDSTSQGTWVGASHLSTWVGSPQADAVQPVRSDSCQPTAAGLSRDAVTSFWGLLIIISGNDITSLALSNTAAGGM